MSGRRSSAPGQGGRGSAGAGPRRPGRLSSGPGRASCSRAACLRAPGGAGPGANGHCFPGPAARAAQPALGRQLQSGAAGASPLPRPAPASRRARRREVRLRAEGRGRAGRPGRGRGARGRGRQGGAGRSGVRAHVAPPRRGPTLPHQDRLGGCGVCQPPSQDSLKARVTGRGLQVRPPPGKPPTFRMPRRVAVERTVSFEGSSSEISGEGGYIQDKCCCALRRRTFVPWRFCCCLRIFLKKLNTYVLHANTRIHSCVEFYVTQECLE